MFPAHFRSIHLLLIPALLADPALGRFPPATSAFSSAANFQCQAITAPLAEGHRNILSKTAGIWSAVLRLLGVRGPQGPADWEETGAMAKGRIKLILPSVLKNTGGRLRIFFYPANNPIERELSLRYELPIDPVG